MSAPAGGPEGPTSAGVSKVSCCEDLNAEGQPCQMPPLQGSRFCWSHDPSKAAERTRARKQGGRNRLLALDNHTPRAAIAIASVSDVLALLQEAASDLLAMRPGERRARALSYLSMSALKALEVGALEERLSALEARADAQPHHLRRMQ